MRRMTMRTLLCGCVLVAGVSAAPGAAGACVPAYPEAHAAARARPHEASLLPGPAGMPGAIGARVMPANEHAVTWRGLDPEAGAETPRSAMDWGRDFGKLLILLSVPMAFVALQVTLHRQLRRRPPAA